MARIRIEIVAEIEVTDLGHYDAATIEEAAENQKSWLEAGDLGIDDLLSACDLVEVVSVVGVP